MGIDANDVKKLRVKTGVGMMDCKRALEEANGDMDKAVEILRKSGLAKAAKKSDREANQGLIMSYIHPGNQIGVLIEVNTETDFVAKTEEVKNFTKNMAMQVAAAAPICIQPDDISEEDLEKEKVIFASIAEKEGKPEKIIPKIVEGKVQKYYEEVCLLEQSYIKENSRKVKDILNDLVAKLGENIIVNRFVRFKVGE
ncbi:translation elongation factor Ts [bacterium]|nr:translation elongation factor Ts [bacterium]